MSLSYCDLLVEIRRHLNLPPNELSSDERKLHCNLTGILKHAHRLTLVKWLDLLREEREATIRRKRTERSKKHGAVCAPYDGIFQLYKIILYPII